jgi:hypothetical protein
LSIKSLATDFLNELAITYDFRYSKSNISVSRDLPETPFSRGREGLEMRGESAIDDFCVGQPNPLLTSSPQTFKLDQ